MGKKITVFMLLWLVLGCIGSAFSAETGTIEWMKEGKVVYLVRTADNFIILYDRSASMKDTYAGTVMTELAAERKILLEKNATLPDMNWQAGIYSFTPGHGFDNLTTYYPMQLYNKKTFSRTISKMDREPKGATLLQQGLSALDQVLAGLSGRTVVFLFTDGQYTPVDSLPPPSALAAGLASRHEVCFIVINTGADKKGQADIQAIASVNDCSYEVPFSALLGNPEWMTSALFSVVDTKPDKGEAMIGYEWQNILFDFDKSDIKPEYYQSLGDAALFLRKHPQARIVLAGHTDNIGTKEYNMQLSHRRAANVRAYLVEKEGIDANRITLNGFGYQDPVATNDTAEGRALNRRVQGVITNF